MEEVRPICTCFVCEGKCTNEQQFYPSFMNVPFKLCYHCHGSCRRKHSILAEGGFENKPPLCACCKCYPHCYSFPLAVSEFKLCTDCREYCHKLPCYNECIDAIPDSSRDSPFKLRSPQFILILENNEGNNLLDDSFTMDTYAYTFSEDGNFNLYMVSTDDEVYNIKVGVIDGSELTFYDMTFDADGNNLSISVPYDCKGCRKIFFQIPPNLNRGIGASACYVFSKNVKGIVNINGLSRGIFFHIDDGTDHLQLGYAGRIFQYLNVVKRALETSDGNYTFQLIVSGYFSEQDLTVELYFDDKTTSSFLSKVSHHGDSVIKIVYPIFQKLKSIDLDQHGFICVDYL